ncbi:MAG: hypothetical protein ACKOGJ_09435, partial [Phycisphaerales bacterium]
MTKACRSPSQAKITGQLEICRWTSVMVRWPGPIDGSVCSTASGHATRTNDASGEAPRPTITGSSACGPAERHGSASAATHSPPTRASTEVPMPLTFVRICCDGSSRPRSHSAAIGQRPVPGAIHCGGSPAAAAGATSTSPRLSTTHGSANILVRHADAISLLDAHGQPVDRVSDVPARAEPCVVD